MSITSDRLIFVRGFKVAIVYYGLEFPMTRELNLKMIVRTHHNKYAMFLTDTLLGNPRWCIGNGQ